MKALKLVRKKRKKVEIQCGNRRIEVLINLDVFGAQCANCCAFRHTCCEYLLRVRANYIPQLIHKALWAKAAPFSEARLSIQESISLDAANNNLGLYIKLLSLKAIETHFVERAS